MMPCAWLGGVLGGCDPELAACMQSESWRAGGAGGGCDATVPKIRSHGPSLAPVRETLILPHASPITASPAEVASRRALTETDIRQSDGVSITFDE